MREIKIFLPVIFTLLLVPAMHAAATLQVTAFSCNPAEVVTNNQFSCTATVQNTGDATGTLNTATLYPDANNWLERNNYPKTVNTAITSGASTQVTFSGLKGKKSGYNGFSKIMLDDVTDTYVADSGTKVNVVDVVGIVTLSSSSATSGGTVIVTGQATVGGNADVMLTFSGGNGCSIGNQPASATTNDMSNGQTTSHTWTVTISADCTHSVAAKVTSNPSGTATKTDMTSGTITCSNCVSTSTTTTAGSGGSSGGSGGSGGAATNVTSNKTVTSNESSTSTIIITTTSIYRDKILCTPSWDCGAWSECINGLQSRTCTDKNNCGNEKPAITQECSAFQQDLVELPKVVKDNSLLILAFLITVGVLGYLYYHKYPGFKRNTNTNSPTQNPRKNSRKTRSN